MACIKKCDERKHGCTHARTLEQPENNMLPQLLRGIKINIKVQGMQQSKTAANPWPQEEDKMDRNERVQNKQTNARKEHRPALSLPSEVISARPQSAEYTIGIYFETAKNTKAFECFFTGFQHSLWKCSTTGNLYSLKSWLWLAAVACVVHWPVSNALLIVISLTCFLECEIETSDTTPCTVVKPAGRLAQMVKASAKTTSCKPLSRRYEFDSSQSRCLFGHVC